MELTAVAEHISQRLVALMTRRSLVQIQPPLPTEFRIPSIDEAVGLCLVRGLEHPRQMG